MIVASVGCLPVYNISYKADPLSAGSWEWITLSANAKDLVLSGANQISSTSYAKRYCAKHYCIAHGVRSIPAYALCALPLAPAA
jgi:hypothetical protein